MTTQKTSPGKATLAIGFMICIALIVGDWFSKVLDNDSAVFLFIMVLLSSVIIYLLIWFVMEFINWIKSWKNKGVATTQIESPQVDKRRLELESNRIRRICRAEQLDEESISRVIDLIRINDGILTTTLMQMHIQYGYGRCLRIYEALIKAKLARPHVKGHLLKQLDFTRQSGYKHTVENWESLLPKAKVIIKDTKIASTASLQRHLKIGYGTAAKIMEELENKGFVGKADGANPRKIYH